VSYAKGLDKYLNENLIDHTVKSSDATQKRHFDRLNWRQKQMTKQGNEFGSVADLKR